MTVDLVPRWTIGSLDLTGYPYSVDASSTVEIGEPEMVVESVASLLADGDLERTVRHGNRLYVLEVYVEGATLAELAKAEAALRSAIVGTGLLLTHDPGDGFSPESAYEVQTARLTPARDDLFESHLIRKYTLTLTCGPFARSAQATTITALAPPPVTPITASVTTADTTDGFTAYASGTYPPGAVVSFPRPVTDMGDYVQAYQAGGEPEMTVTFTPASPFATSTTPFIIVETSGDYPGSFSINGQVVGIAMSRATSLGTTIYALYTGEVTVSSISVYRKLYAGAPDAPARLTINIHNIYRTNTLPQVTGRQTSAVVEIGGTERTPCSLQVNPAAGEQMGIGIVHTCPEEGIGYSPPLRQRRISGNPVTVGGNLMSGAVEGVTSTPVVATVPVRSLPEDGYSLVALLRSSVAGTFPIAYNVRTAFAGNYIGGSVVRVAQATFNAADTWTLVPLGNLTLPPVRASQEAFVQFDLYRTTVASEVIELDEWWAFRMGEDCALTMVQSPRSYLWLDSPDVSSPVPRVWIGNNADRTDAHHPGFWLINQGNHVLHPNGTSVFVATNGIANPTVTATAYRRWHSNAAS